MNKLRLSYTFMNLWDRGQIDDAISAYFHLDTIDTRQMQEGRLFHDTIKRHIEKRGKFPSWFFNGGLSSPEPEKEVVVSYNEQFNLKSIYDCLGDGVLYEYKTGVSNSLDWGRTMQIPFYFLVGELAEEEIKMAYLIHYNQYDETTDYILIHNTKGLRDKARNWIDSYAPEIYEYFVQKGLFNERI